MGPLVEMTRKQRHREVFTANKKTAEFRFNTGFALSNTKLQDFILAGGRKAMYVRVPPRRPKMTPR